MLIICSINNLVAVGLSWTEKETENDLGYVLEDEDDGGEEEDRRETKSANTSPSHKRKTERFLSTVQPPLTKSRKISYKDETNKFRDHNLFNKKVPKNAEVVNIQV